MDGQELRAFIKGGGWLDVGDIRPKMESLSKIELKRWEPSFINPSRQTNEDRICDIYRDILMRGVSWKGRQAVYQGFFDISIEAMLRMETIKDMPYPFTLAIGEAYEEAVAAYLRLHGFRCSRFKQRNLPSNMLRKHQRDIRIFTADGRRLNVELKALRGGSFKPHGVLVGDIRKWDEKAFPVAICMIVNQDTGEIRWAVADEIARQQWQQIKMANETSYLIPSALWMPLERLAKALGYML